MKQYKSSVLRCHAGDDTCELCRFLDGEREEQTLLRVIDVLDAKLHEEEELASMLLVTIATMKKEAGCQTKNP